MIEVGGLSVRVRVRVRGFGLEGLLIAAGL
jgi:hypothetical protein